MGVIQYKLAVAVTAGKYVIMGHVIPGLFLDLLGGCTDVWSPAPPSSCFVVQVGRICS